MSNNIKKPLFDNDGARVCADHEIVKRFGQSDLIVMFDDFGKETGREAVGDRDLYEAASDKVAIYGDNVRTGREALKLRPRQGASKEERRRFYELQKAALGVTAKGTAAKSVR